MEYKVGDRVVSNARGEGTIIGIVQNGGSTGSKEYEVRFDINVILPWPFSKLSHPVEIYAPCNLYKRTNK